MKQTNRCKKSRHNVRLLPVVKTMLMALLFLPLIVGACDDDEKNSCFRCVYEKRTSACGGGSYGAWTDMEITYNTDDIKDGLSKQDVCNLIKSTTHCESTCCINYQVRNVKLAPCD